MNKEEIRHKVIEVIENAVNVNLAEFPVQQLEKSLFDLETGLLPRDLLEIFFALQDAFDISFEERDIIDSRFDVLDNIVDCIYDKVMGIQPV